MKERMELGGLARKSVMMFLKRFCREMNSLRRLGGVLLVIHYVVKVVTHVPAILHENNLQPADNAMAGKLYRFSVFGRHILLDGKWVGGARELYGRKVYFATPGFDIRPNDIVCDLGCNVGVFTLLAAMSAHRVLAIDAQRPLLDQLYVNLCLNNCADKVWIRWARIGRTAGLLSDPHKFSNQPMPENVELSQLLREACVPRIDFLKIDIEGSEFPLFRSDITWLGKVRRIAMEVHTAFGNPVDIVTILEREGFKVSLVDNNQTVVNRICDQSGYLFAIKPQL